jgi:hypothetical protein
MTHARQKIRYAVAAALASIPATANRIYPTKRYSWMSDQLPGIAVYTDSAQVEYLHRDREQRHSLNLILECAASDPDTLDDDLDDICAAVEVAIEADPTFGGLANDAMLASISTLTDAGGERPVGILRLTYTVTYVTPAANPEGVA